jgi:hypothetical protein
MGERYRGIESRQAKNSIPRKINMCCASLQIALFGMVFASFAYRGALRLCCAFLPKNGGIPPNGAALPGSVTKLPLSRLWLEKPFLTGKF